MKKHLLYLIPLRFISVCLVISSCGGGAEEENAEKKMDTMIDSSNVTIGVGGKVFIIPSPIQTAILIQKSGAQYDKVMLNSPDKVNSYSTRFQKCLNLGIYGADLGYTTLYDQSQDALMYFKATNTLANDLGLSNAFDKSLIERFQKNIGKKDSILVLVSSAYRASNDFLKNNERNEEAALIVAGGWIETLQFAINIMRSKSNEDVKRRIAEQKSTLNNLIALISTYQGKEEYAELLVKLNDLKSEYDKVEYKYIYSQPVTDEVNKSTTITSKSEITISPENIQIIGDKISAIRSLIIA
ncbi:MAG: hypothetical protein EPN85_14055 [Bacteroidetes bacterium]|nr:MAG: hypothetical protein EPN85_14055 [Bacteroidota bacterium]